MRRILTSSFRLLLGAAAVIAAGIGGAQSPTDYPTLKGSAQRTGTNGDPAGSSPGLLRRESSNVPGVTNSSLRWIQPLISATPVSALRLNEVNPLVTIVDNTDDGNPNQTDSAGNVVGPFDPLPNGGVVRVGAWSRPNEAEEAIFPYVPIRRRNINGTFARDPNPRFPAYEYVQTVASAPGRDPRVPVNPLLLRTFTWSFTPSVNTTLNPPFTAVQDGGRRSYALYVQIPEGQTVVGGNLVPRQRFFVYEVTYGGNRKYVAVLDANAAGAGFVRIGGPTVVFPYDGVNPLRLTLYNTIPRDADGNLTEVVTNPAVFQNRLVYADAAQFSRNTSSILATPTQAGFGTADIRVVSARNEITNDDDGTDPGFLTPPPTNTSAVVSSYVFNTGAPQWSYRLDGANGSQTVNVEDDAATVTNAGFTADNTAAYRFLGNRLLLSPVAGATPTANVLVDPQATLADGEYEIQMYVGGRTGNVTAAAELATSAQYEIFEGGVSAGVFTLNEAAGEPGYRRLGIRRYRHSAAAPLTVQFYNSTSNVAGDTGRVVSVDAFRFLVPGQNSVVSTPLQATALVRQTVGADPVPTNVVLIADERGRIHAVDAAGNNVTGQTRTYWVYPSYTDNGLKDPNTDPTAPGAPINPLRDGADGLEATLPTFFDLSSAVIRRLTVLDGGGNPVLRDYLFVGAGNGRIYSIAMEGRGDADPATGQPGTTFRRWTYPDTYPATEQTTSLGKVASVVAGNVGGTETIYAATESGRVYALPALGGSNLLYGDAGLTAGAPLWRYPAANAPTLGAIEGAPALDAAGNRLFVPTFRKNEAPGALLALDATTGAPIWTFASNGTVSPFTLDFRSGPAFVSGAELNDPALVAGVPAPDSVFAMNENGYVYAIDAGTGTELWRTNELQSGGRASLGYMRLTTFDQTGVAGLFPTLTVPTENGRFAALFARVGDTTIFGNRLVFGARVESRITASIAVGNRWLYGASEDGFLYAFSDVVNGGSFLPGGFIPNISEDIVDNDPDPSVAAFRNAELGLLSRQGFVTLRQTEPGGITGTQDFETVIDTTATWASPDGRIKAPFRSGRTSPVFEWGETIYLLVYNFPATQTDTAGQTIAPPVVEALVTTQGKAARPIVAEARIFRNRTSADADGGYAIIQVPLTAGGQTSLPPGPGTIQISIRTSAGNRTFVPQQINPNPARSRLAYRIANPLGIAMQPPAGTAQTAYTLGYTTDAANEDNRLNGVDSYETIAGRNPVNLATSFGIGFNGQSRTQRIYVYDRSLMTLLRGEGRGLDNLRFERKELEWQGGAASVVKGMVASYGLLFATMEDLPVNLPNDSLDYPNVRRDRVTVTKDPQGNAENPLFSGVTLKGPRDGSGNPVTEATAASRLLIPTPFDLKLDIPRYQPPAFVPVASQVADSAGTLLDQGYGARVGVYVDSDGNGALNQSREAYRPFSMFAAVAPDERIVVNTPTLDLGSLSSGAGYDTTLTYTAAAPYRVMGAPVSPWTGAYAGMFKGFEARNEGNVNLLNVRVAKGSLDTTGANPVVYPWQTFSPTNDENSAWLDALLDVWSDLDVTFAPAWAAGRNEVVAPKPRVNDVAGRPIYANPTKRFNPNVAGADGNPFIAGLPSRDPRIGVSLPLGFPVGTYGQTFRLIEDFRFGTPATNNDELLSLNYSANGQVNPVESYSDPGLRLSFTAVETPLTGGAAAFVAEQVDSGSSRTAAQVQDDVNNGRVTKWASRQPAAIRSESGAMGLVFSSNRPQWIPTQDATPTEGSAYRLWFAGLAGNDPGAARAGRAPESQTRDLNRFQPNNAFRFWRQGAGAYPAATAATLFPPTASGGAAIEGSQTFGLPSLPANGFSDPLQYGAPGTTQFPSVTLGFVGSVFRTGSAGNVTDSRIFAASYSLGQDGTPTVGSPVGLDFAPQAKKGRPAVVQSNAPTGGNGATIVFAATVNNAPRLWFTRFNGSQFTAPIALNVGNAFESVSEPSASLRPYGGGAALQLAFTGRVRGRTSSEVFLMNVLLGPDHLPIQPLQFVYFQVAKERAVFDERTGTYRVRGAYLREPSPPGPGGVPAAYDDLVGLSASPTGPPIPEIRSDRAVDRESRVEGASSVTLGGRIVFDRNAGTVRLVGSVNPPNRDLLVTYQSAIYRVSDASASGYSSPNVLQDTRLAPGNLTAAGDAYWYTNTNAIAAPGAPNTFADRTYLVYTRGSQAGGAVARPFSVTFRPGVRIGRVIATNPDGSFAEPVTVANAIGPYQVDPSGGRIYFTRADEGNPNLIVTVGTGLSQVIAYGPIGIVGETIESPIPLGRPLNETNMFAFLDPVFPQTPRRGMIWMFWSSTRNGAPNIFFQSVAPALSAPVPAP